MRLYMLYSVNTNDNKTFYLSNILSNHVSAYVKVIIKRIQASSSWESKGLQKQTLEKKTVGKYLKALT